MSENADADRRGSYRVETYPIQFPAGYIPSNPKANKPKPKDEKVQRAPFVPVDYDTYRAQCRQNTTVNEVFEVTPDPPPGFWERLFSCGRARKVKPQQRIPQARAAYDGGGFARAAPVPSYTVPVVATAAYDGGGQSRQQRVDLSPPELTAAIDAGLVRPALQLDISKGPPVAAYDAARSAPPQLDYEPDLKPIAAYESARPSRENSQQLAAMAVPQSAIEAPRRAAVISPVSESDAVPTSPRTGPGLPPRVKT